MPSGRCCGPAAGSRCRTSTPRTGASTVPDAEGIHHLGFDRDRLRGLAEAAGFADVGFTAAHVYENERGAFPMFLLTATRT